MGILKKLKDSNISIKKILYLHDFDGWAIHNVGKLWLGNLKGIKVTFKNYRKFNKKDFIDYDLVWFGYLDLFFNLRLIHLFNNYEMEKCVVAIHDPVELFPPVKSWKSEKINLKKWWSLSTWIRWKKLRLLKKIKHIVTISEEMKSILDGYGIKSHLIPTMSSLPIIKKEKIITKKCDIHSVFNISPRKNLELMNYLQNYCKNKLKIKFDLKLGNKILPVEKYKALLDTHEIYVCTSFQEGGPLPAMDAMTRGSVVITTPVGQLQDIIEDGKNGFICNTKDEFLKKIKTLSKDLKLLHKMRIKSRSAINKKKNKKVIKKMVLKFFGSCFEDNQTSKKNYQQEMFREIIKK